MYLAAKKTERRTENDNVENQDDESNDATASTILPSVSRGSRDLAGERSSECEGGQAKLEEDGQSVLEHVGSSINGDELIAVSRSMLLSRSDLSRRSVRVAVLSEKNIADRYGLTTPLFVGVGLLDASWLPKVQSYIQVSELAFQ